MKTIKNIKASKVKQAFGPAYAELERYVGPDADDRGEDPSDIDDNGFELRPVDDDGTFEPATLSLDDEVGWDVVPGYVLCYVDDAYSLAWLGPKRGEFSGGWQSND